MAPVTIKINEYYKGDSWSGLDIGPILIDGVQPLLTLASCRMHFRNADGALGYALNTVPTADKGTIVISNATTWEVTIPTQILDLIAGKWLWDFETTDSAGNVLTLYKGSLTVKQDVTYG